jgi:hypothetical protein
MRLKQMISSFIWSMLLLMMAMISSRYMASERSTITPGHSYKHFKAQTMLPEIELIIYLFSARVVWYINIVTSRTPPQKMPDDFHFARQLEILTRVDFQPDFARSMWLLRWWSSDIIDSASSLSSPPLGCWKFTASTPISLTITGASHSALHASLACLLPW